MNDIDTPAEPGAPPPHPLACDLAHRIAGETRPRVLLLGYGSGRNVPVFLQAGALLEIVDADERRAAAARAALGGDARVRVYAAQYDAPAGVAPGCTAALSTHALLHGTRPVIERALNAVRELLSPGAPFYLTLGTKSDPRFGKGTRLAPDTYAPLSGSEAGVPHSYFNESEARTLLRHFDIEALENGDASNTAGSWAHGASEAATLRHLFVRAIRRSR